MDWKRFERSSRESKGSREVISRKESIDCKRAGIKGSLEESWWAEKGGREKSWRAKKERTDENWWGKKVRRK